MWVGGVTTQSMGVWCDWVCGGITQSVGVWCDWVWCEYPECGCVVL